MKEKDRVTIASGKMVFATSGKSDFAIIGLGLQKIPTNSSQ